MSVKLSVVIPAYGRETQLLYSLQKFVAQISRLPRKTVEVIVVDDDSPAPGLPKVKSTCAEHDFLTYVKNKKNIGLEKNLIHCTQYATGEYLWIFGDDDFLEHEEALSDVIELLDSEKVDVVVVNRTRRNFGGDTVLSENWMGIDPQSSRMFPGLSDFCVEFGLISVIGFISVNIFKREPFCVANPAPYFGTMYPQVGAMLQAFGSTGRTLLIGKPTVCHRTQTPEEKRLALGKKASESQFMSNEGERNARYFSYPWVEMVKRLVDQGAMTESQLSEMRECTVINGPVVEFFLRNLELHSDLPDLISARSLRAALNLFTSLKLKPEQERRAITAIRTEFEKIKGGETVKVLDGRVKTISVITPSYNQADYLPRCLQSVVSQTLKAMEHLVFDPGSIDGSVDIARSHDHVTLFNQPDEGQSDALNQGFLKAKGDIIAWLNSDDFYWSDDVFSVVMARFNEPDAPDIIYGRGNFVGSDGAVLREAYVNRDPSSLSHRFQHEDGILQPALFFRRSLIADVGLLRKDRHFCMDYEYWIRCKLAGKKFVFIDKFLAGATFHTDNKTFGSRDKSYEDVCDMLREHFGYANHIWLRRYAEYLSAGYDGVLQHASNTKQHKEEDVEKVYRKLMTDYNGAPVTRDLLQSRSSEKGFGDTFREMEALQLWSSAKCRPIAEPESRRGGTVVRKVGEQDWEFDAAWRQSILDAAHDFLRRRMAVRKNDTVVIIGNGPSLNKIDFDLLKNFDVIMSNNTFLSEDLIDKATYYTCVNYKVAEQSSYYINMLGNCFKVLPYWLAPYLNPGENSFFVEAKGFPEFSTNMFKNMSWRHTVTFFNMHLAYGLGYKNVLLTGFDHSYVQPKDAVEQEMLKSDEEDVNHFHPNYFQGKDWQAADADMMGEMYKLARKAFEEDGRRVINATVGGKLEVFDRAPLESFVESKPIVAPLPSSPGQTDYLLGPFSREDKRGVDESHAIYQLFASASKTDGVMIDVGAHVGTALMPFLEAGWKVHAFEPDDVNRAHLVKALELSENGGNCALNTSCVGQTERDSVAFYRSEVSTGISGLSAFHESHQDAGNVAMTSLATYIDQKNIDAIDFLKVDTEGFDLDVLMGFPWDTLLPAVVECEFENNKTLPLGYTFEELAGFLVKKGYKVFVSEWHPIVKYGQSHDWRGLYEYREGYKCESGWGNFVAVTAAYPEDSVVNAFSSRVHQRR